MGSGPFVVAACERGKMLAPEQRLAATEVGAGEWNGCCPRRPACWRRLAEGGHSLARRSGPMSFWLRLDTARGCAAVAGWRLPPNDADPCKFPGVAVWGVDSACCRRKQLMLTSGLHLGRRLAAAVEAATAPCQRVGSVRRDSPLPPGPSVAAGGGGHLGDERSGSRGSTPFSVDPAARS